MQCKAVKTMTWLPKGGAAKSTNSSKGVSAAGRPLLLSLVLRSKVGARLWILLAAIL